MAKQKYVKIQVNLQVGNRKSVVVDPIEVEEDVNSYDGELTDLIMDFVEAVKALPTASGAYTQSDVVDTICECFDLQRKPKAE